MRVPTLAENKLDDCPFFAEGMTARVLCPRECVGIANFTAMAHESSFRQSGKSED
jgi:hypothetical protein